MYPQNFINLNVPPFLSPILFRKNNHPPPFSLAKYKIHMDSHFKEAVTDLFWKLLGIPHPHRQSANGYIATLF